MSTIINIIKILYLIPSVVYKDYQNRKWRKAPKIGDTAYFITSKDEKRLVKLIEINSNNTSAECINKAEIKGIYRIEILKIK